ncbi:M23 family metallopeptidase [Corynebacterium sanguinis]|uniref:M23 family metallopeptidase n=1 Tax=Corynebacterium sanguinis TaxID=2594913 RepID=A0A6C1TV73_9CORY|nr:MULTISPECIES: M23 family metallopeptidase [Corynebacterium]MBA4505242.1 M23 family metallopeptidase [Corynebacterium sanguinis]MCT1411767.1 M23 family metallopeptidase [Corynebacterium sanguinis]MCT1413705.1 M23 family metallopeptidase [Corynebacterium sanguinis]MCT1425297.1 M23 family metallopeptidase [Corynebacterium sanguinis]MCT1444297.1 M23 family metallopeptidase [Corynebacterium sanguinis]
MKRPLLAALAATLTLSAAAVPASAITVNLDGVPASSDIEIANALALAVGKIYTNGATFTAGDHSIVFDPRAEEQRLNLPAETIQIVPPEGSDTVVYQTGATSDGRTVVTPATGRLSSGFGPRGGRIHQGIDIANDSGSPIYAVMDGTVINAGPAQGFGNWVVIKHDGGEVSVYGHMRNYSVSVGQRVSAGEQIAQIGNEGRSTGPHLHFEIRPDGVTPVDPQVWLNKQGIRI